MITRNTEHRVCAAAGSIAKRINRSRNIINVIRPVALLDQVAGDNHQVRGRTVHDLLPQICQSIDQGRQGERAFALFIPCSPNVKIRHMQDIQ
jgi:hypothetical protein